MEPMEEGDLRRAFDAIGSMVLVLDPEGGIRDRNRAAPAAAGNIRDLEAGEPWRTAARLVRQAAAARAPATEGAREPGGARSWEVEATPAPGAGGLLVLVVREVTRLVAEERSLIRCEDLACLGSLVSGVAHEVRNPLFTISATLDAFEARFGASDENRRFLDTLHAGVNQISALVNNLLDYGHPPEICTAPGSLEAAARPALERLIPRAEGIGIRLEIRIPEGLPSILMDRDRVTQAIQNLVENALYYTRVGGRIAVGAGAVTRDGRRWVECRVEGAGPPIGPEDLGRIFEPFFHQHYGESGLGLPIARRIVEQHGGTLEARHLPGGGMAVAFLLPVVEG
jgi:signal transduction histidine kinase